MLTDTTIRAAKPSEKPRKLADSRGLYLLINPNGSKLWRLKYRIDGKEKLLALGAYPDVTLELARDRRDDARKLIANSIDPAVVRREGRRAEAGEDTFEYIAKQWLARQRNVWASGHTDTVQARLDNDILPYIGSRAASPRPSTRYARARGTDPQ